MRDMEPEIARTLQLLRTAGELLFFEPGVSRRTSCLAEMAEPTLVADR